MTTPHASDPLIRTKLRLPLTRADRIERPRLQQQLAEGLRGPLTLVAAPAGFGKTTLVAAAVAHYDQPVAWLALDPGDNQVGRFLRYVAAAVQMALPTVGDEAAQLLAAAPPAPPEAVLTSLINDLESAGTGLVLVLDDYHCLHNPEIHSAMTFLLDHQPARLRLVIATRSDPPLPVARLRARGQMVELRADDLRFTRSEAAQFLNAVMGLQLDDRDVAALEARTEGWIAGLQMAALSMRDRADTAGLIEKFSGTHRYILDYLLEEVLAGQPPDIQRFLLHTAILDRLCAPLCAALLLPSETVPDSATTLTYLEKANLFLVPLDDQRQWFRYHHLFADLLRARLDQLYPGERPRLHARAAAWLAAAGMTVEAVNHAISAGQYDQAARLVEQNTTRLLAQGEMGALMSWIEALPADLRRARPWLCVHQSYALAFAGRLAEVPPLLAQAEAAAAGEPALSGAIAAVRAMAAVMTGRDAEAVTLAEQASARLPADHHWDRATAAWARGFALRGLGRLEAAAHAFEEQAQLGQVLDNIWTRVTGLTDLAQVRRLQGDLPQARALVEAALAEAERQGARSRGYIARMEAGLAGVLYEQNELESAERLLTAAIDHTLHWPNPNHLSYAYVLLTRVRLAQGDLAAARLAIEAADQVRRTAPLTRMNRRMVEADWVQVWLAQRRAGAISAADDQQAEAILDDWRTELADPEARLDECAEFAARAQARVLLAEGHAAEAQARLEQVIRSTRQTGRINGAIQALALYAVAQLTPNSALAALREALQLAAPGGYVRVFIDEGPPMQGLLAAWLAQSADSPLQAYAQRVLAHFPSGPDLPAAPVTPADLIEPLSRRELEILTYLATGMTNQEIARRLFVAPGTVKAHSASIYRKLGVANRTEAAARARQLGLLL